MYTIIENKRHYLVATISGKITNDDYDKISPLIDQKVAEEGKLNALFIIESIDSMSAKALWEDLKVDFKHANDFGKVAIVGDKKWEWALTQISKPFTSAEIRFFNKEERAEAEAWVKPG